MKADENGNAPAAENRSPSGTTSMESTAPSQTTSGVWLADTQPARKKDLNVNVKVTVNLIMIDFINLKVKFVGILIAPTVPPQTAREPECVKARS